MAATGALFAEKESYRATSEDGARNRSQKSDVVPVTYGRSRLAGWRSEAESESKLRYGKPRTAEKPPRALRLEEPWQVVRRKWRFAHEEACSIRVSRRPEIQRRYSQRRADWLQTQIPTGPAVASTDTALTASASFFLDTIRPQLLVIYPPPRFPPPISALRSPTAVCTLTMTEYDYSPAAYEKYLENQNRVSNWVNTQAYHAKHYANPFIPPSEAAAPSSSSSRARSPPHSSSAHYRSGSSSRQTSPTPVASPTYVSSRPSAHRSATMPIVVDSHNHHQSRHSRSTSRTTAIPPPPPPPPQMYYPSGYQTTSPVSMVYAQYPAQTSPRAIYSTSKHGETKHIKVTVAPGERVVIQPGSRRVDYVSDSHVRKRDNSLTVPPLPIPVPLPVSSPPPPHTSKPHTKQYTPMNTLTPDTRSSSRSSSARSPTKKSQPFFKRIFTGAGGGGSGSGGGGGGGSGSRGSHQSNRLTRVNSHSGHYYDGRRERRLSY
ncbi:hypothetical protein K474DRAFT_1711872 [Panus rudis PR-1116 ss-1]|nr:hypothetical protein K474DRAFT_1711872 [Panus rudis PR-1116 ss-1]